MQFSVWCRNALSFSLCSYIPFGNHGFSWMLWSNWLPLVFSFRENLVCKMQFWNFLHFWCCEQFNGQHPWTKSNALSLWISFSPQIVHKCSLIQCPLRILNFHHEFMQWALFVVFLWVSMKFSPSNTAQCDFLALHSPGPIPRLVLILLIKSPNLFALSRYRSCIIQSQSEWLWWKRHNRKFQNQSWLEYTLRKMSKFCNSKR